MPVCEYRYEHPPKVALWNACGNLIIIIFFMQVSLPHRKQVRFLSFGQIFKRSYYEKR